MMISKTPTVVLILVCMFPMIASIPALGSDTNSSHLLNALQLFAKMILDKLISVFKYWLPTKSYISVVEEPEAQEVWYDALSVQNESEYEEEDEGYFIEECYNFDDYRGLYENLKKFINRNLFGCKSLQVEKNCDQATSNNIDLCKANATALENYLKKFKIYVIDDTKLVVKSESAFLPKHNVSEEVNFQEMLTPRIAIFDVVWSLGSFDKVKRMNSLFQYLFSRLPAPFSAMVLDLQLNTKNINSDLHYYEDSSSVISKSFHSFQEKFNNKLERNNFAPSLLKINLTETNNTAIYVSIDINHPLIKIMLQKYGVSAIYDAIKTALGINELSLTISYKRIDENTIRIEKALFDGLIITPLFKGTNAITVCITKDEEEEFMRLSLFWIIAALGELI